MKQHTAVLEDVAVALKEVSEHTGVLPGLRSDMARVAATTGVLEPMDGRMASIEAAMPVLVDVQKHLTRVPDTIEHLDSRIDELNGLLGRLLESMQGLSASVDQLQGSVGPLGRIARRLPGSRKRVAAAAAQALARTSPPDMSGEPSIMSATFSATHSLALLTDSRRRPRRRRS